DIQARLASKQHELDVLDADIRTQEERITLVQTTWQRDVSARRAELDQADAGSRLAERTYAREAALVRTGISPAQTLDDRRAAHDQARSGVERAREMLARSEAEQRTITLAQQELASLHAKRELTTAQLGELRVTETKYTIRAPATPTVVQTQFIWPGELAQPGAAIVSVLDPTDKYVQVYVPVPEVGSFHVGRRVEIDLTIDERQIVGVVGPDGAGKTTLLRALAGLLVVDAEEATVLGTDLRGDVTELKAHIGYVPQSFSLHRDLTVDENLRFTARLH